ncbi:MAG: DUF1697 domain-containing protein [Sphingosinicella sp.]|nr:DUF1697 domain-containing protein [Sphingosinicella sp.]
MLKIALFRSIQINGRRVNMADAKALASEAGGTDISSIVSTGNLLLRSRKSTHELEIACARFYGRPTEMVVKTADQWYEILAANPFADEAERAPSRLLVWAMRDPLPDSGLDQLRRRATGEERIERIASGDFYIWFGQGDISRSKITAGFGLKALGAVGTNRNWNTVTKVAAALKIARG